MRLKILLYLVLIGISVQAQQKPHYTQYLLNNYIINPALSGIDNYIDVKLSTRNQWIGIDGAPRTYYATINGSVGKQDYRQNATSFDMIGRNTHGNDFLENYTPLTPHHGWGFTAINYKTGYIDRSTAYGTYAYHLGLNKDYSLSAGFGAGGSLITVDASKITLAQPGDLAIGSAIDKINLIKPELNAGLWLYSAKLFAGISAQQIIPSKLSLVESSLNKSTTVPHLFLTAGYRMRATYDVYVLPSMMVRYIPGIPTGIDLNCRVQYLDLLWIGGNFRKGDGFSAICGMNVNRMFQFSYSYDTNNGKYLLSTMNKGTHEIVLGFVLRNRHDDF